MKSNKSVYSAEKDNSSREQGLVYIEDLAANSVLGALKSNCMPQGLGFLAAAPNISLQDTGEQELVSLADYLRERIKELQAQEHGAVDVVNASLFREISVSKMLGKISVSVDYWEGRPIKTSLSADENIDPTTLTGFEPFDPFLFDRDQGAGSAQYAIDSLRASISSK